MLGGSQSRWLHCRQCRADDWAGVGGVGVGGEGWISKNRHNLSMSNGFLNDQDQVLIIG